MRKAAAAGLGGLAVAIFIGVMAFAFTTTPAVDRADAPEDSWLAVATGTVEYLLNPGKSADVRSLSASRPRIEEATAVSIIPVNAQALMASRDGVRDEVVDETDALEAAATPEPERDPPAATQDAGQHAEADTVRTASVAPGAGGATPALVVGDQVQATVSFYYCERGSQGLHPGDGGNFCGVMRDGQVVYPGAAACAYIYLGQRFRIVGDPLDRVYTCADTGSAVHGLHRDIWFMNSDEGWSWQRRVGQVATIEIVD